MKRIFLLTLIFSYLYGFDTPLITRSYSFGPSIDTAGYYRLADPVTNQITITASNVTLDMNGQTVSGGTNGIVINSGLSNVTIMNGTISSVTTDGIQVGSGCSNITLDSVTIKSALQGLNFSNVTNSMISNCDMILNTTGVVITNGHNLLFENCTAQANRNAGYDLISCTTCAFFDCKALSTGQGNTSLFGNPSNVFGFVSVAGTGNIFERCIANSSLNLTATAPATLIAGFGLRTGENCSKIIDCEASNNTSSVSGVTMPYGIWLESTLDNLTTITQVFAGSTSSQVDSVSWSPDGKYLVAGTTVQSGTTENVGLFEFDRISGQLILYDLVSIGDNTFAISWSPSGQYVAIGRGGNILAIYSFDPVAIELNLVRSVSTGRSITSVSWTADEKYIATGQDGVGSQGSVIYAFNVITDTVTTATIIDKGGTDGAETVAWSPVNIYQLAIGDDDGFLRIYNFTPPSIASSVTLLQLGSSGNDINKIQWSYDGKYIAAGGRLFYVLGEGKNVAIARQKAYNALSRIRIGRGLMHYRKDIGHRAIGGAKP